MINPFRKARPRTAFDIAGTFDGATTLDEIIDRLRRHARTLAGADGITVVLREDDEVSYVTEDAVAPLWSGQRFPARQCITGMAILGGAPIIIPDIAADPRVPLHLYLATFVRGMAVFPIGRDNPSMAVGLYWRKAGLPDQAALDRIAALAHHAGDALAVIPVPAQSRAA